MAYRLLCVRFTCLVHAPHSLLTIRALRRRCNTRYGWVVSPYPTGTRTPQDTPSFAWHNNDPHQRAVHASEAPLTRIRCMGLLGVQAVALHSLANEYFASKRSDMIQHFEDSGCYAFGWELVEP